MAASVTGTPMWSPDGRQIAFDSQLRGHTDIYLVGLDGSAPRRVTDDGFDVHSFFGKYQPASWLSFLEIDQPLAEQRG